MSVDTTRDPHPRPLPEPDWSPQVRADNDNPALAQRIAADLCAAIAADAGVPEAPEVDLASFRAGYTAGQADAYTGAADDPGDPATVATPAQWLRRLFDLDGPQRHAVAKRMSDLTRAGARCYEAEHQERLAAARLELAAARGDVEDAERVAADHQARLDAATAQLDAARTAVEEAARVNEEARTEVRAARDTMRAARPLAAERGWDGAAERLAAYNKTLAQAIRAANPHRDHGTTEVRVFGHAEPVATFPADWTERLHDAVGVTDDQGDHQ